MTEFNWQRAVIKVGSALIAPDGIEVSGTYLLSIARFITQSRDAGKEVILVSSGSVAAGRNRIAHNCAPAIAEKQAMAAIGQTQMMANWQRFFDVPCAQLLVTADDLRDRTRYVNISNTLRELLKNQALPIVNENDTVAVNELKVGDNDNLAAYVALVAQADTLIICSDVDGLFNMDPRGNADAERIPVVSSVGEREMSLAGGAGSAVGTGGMRTKLEAAQKCTHAGIQTLIVNGQNSAVFESLANGRCPGTFFIPNDNADNARRSWLRHTLVSRGQLCLDDGAASAVRDRGASLLPKGIVAVEGDFSSGDAVEMVWQNQVIAKGLSIYGARDLRKISGLHSADIAQTLGYSLGEVAVHRDDLVLIKGTHKGKVGEL